MCILAMGHTIKYLCWWFDDPWVAELGRDSWNCAKHLKQYWCGFKTKLADLRWFESGAIWLDSKRQPGMLLMMMFLMLLFNPILPAVEDHYKWGFSHVETLSKGRKHIEWRRCFLAGFPGKKQHVEFDMPWLADWWHCVGNCGPNFFIM